LSGLFSSDVSGRPAQEPAIALSDGKRKVQVTLDLQIDASQAPNFAVQGAQLVALKKDDRGRWRITLLPEKGTWQASVLVAAGGELKSYPLTVAPPLDAVLAGRLRPENFSRELDSYAFSRAAGESPSPRYLSDYIFTANYLSRAR
jgi:hypothetical protein